MPLNQAEKDQIHRGLMRYLSDLRDETDLTKAELVAAVNAVDSWIDSNQGSFNSSLPTAFRTGASAAQKTLLFCVIAAMRVSPNFARRLLGDLD